MALNVELKLRTIKELLALQFDHWKSKNKELLELDFELGSLQKKRALVPQKFPKL